MKILVLALKLCYIYISFSLCLFYLEFLEIIDSFHEFLSSNRSLLLWLFFPTFFFRFGTSIVQILLVCLMARSSMESFISSIFSFLFFRMDYFYWFIFSFVEFLFYHFKSTFAQIQLGDGSNSRQEGLRLPPFFLGGQKFFINWHLSICCLVNLQCSERVVFYNIV